MTFLRPAAPEVQYNTARLYFLQRSNRCDSHVFFGRSFSVGRGDHVCWLGFRLRVWCLLGGRCSRYCCKILVSCRRGSALFLCGDVRVVSCVIRGPCVIARLLASLVEDVSIQARFVDCCCPAQLGGWLAWCCPSGEWTREVRRVLCAAAVGTAWQQGVRLRGAVDGDVWGKCSVREPNTCGRRTNRVWGWLLSK